MTCDWRSPAPDIMFGYRSGAVWIQGAAARDSDGVNESKKRILSMRAGSVTSAIKASGESVSIVDTSLIEESRLTAVLHSLAAAVDATLEGWLTSEIPARPHRGVVPFRLAVVLNRVLFIAIRALYQQSHAIWVY